MVTPMDSISFPFIGSEAQVCAMKARSWLPAELDGLEFGQASSRGKILYGERYSGADLNYTAWVWIRTL